MGDKEPKPFRRRFTIACDLACRGIQKRLTIGWVILVTAILTFLISRVYFANKCPPPKTVPPNFVKDTSPTYMLHGDRVDSGYLKHVMAVLQRLGFRRVHNDSNFDLLWSHVYPFGDSSPFPKHIMQNLRPYQKVNHFPGSGYFTNKVELAISSLQCVPKAFQLPSQKHIFLQYIEKHPDLLFVQKSNSHRGIKIVNVQEMNLDLAGTFVQEYVQNPFLIDGYKFDIGIYTVLTSIDPLRVYIYNGDVLLRFCSKKYHPFDPDIVDKYVVGDDYLPIWLISPLRKSYADRKFSMKETLNAYLRKTGKNPSRLWDQIESSIMNVFLENEEKILGSTKRYKNFANFFELVRFDFIVDDALKVYLMEVNMSPNLSSDHFGPNKLLYENVLFGLFSLVGLAKRTKSLHPRTNDEERMEVSDKNLAVFGNECTEKRCDNCGGPYCALCNHCLRAQSLTILKEAYLEHVNKIDYKRIFPPKMDPNIKIKNVAFEHHSPENRLMLMWFLGKCQQDTSWC